jgi:hypothetical protein
VAAQETNGKPAHTDRRRRSAGDIAVIVDACLFSAEQEVLTLRFLTLKDVVDRFVVVACEATHQGQVADHDLIVQAFNDAVDRAKPRLATLHWVTPSRVLKRRGILHERGPDERGPVGSIWYNHIESQHRDGLLQAVQSVCDDPNALVMCSDVDELPKPETVATLAERWAGHPEMLGRFTLEMRYHSTYLDCRHPQGVWFGTTITRLADCKPQADRDARTTIGTNHQTITVIRDAGIHASWVGNDAERQRKMETFSHAELAAAGFDPVEARRTHRHADGQKLVRVSLAESYAMWWPAPLLDGRFQMPDGWLSKDAWSEDTAS